MPTKILLGTDGSEDAALAARVAIDLSSRTGAELHVVHVWQELPQRWYPAANAAYLSRLHARQAWELLERRVEEIKDAGAVVTESHRRLGHPADEIVGLAEELGADLIVVGSRGLGSVRRLLMGSVSEGVVHHARCPVLVVRGGKESWPPERVVVGDDGSESAKRAAAMGASIGKLFGADTLLVHGYPGLPRHPESLPRDEREQYESIVEDDMRRAGEALEERAAELADGAGRRPKFLVVTGDAAQALLDTAKENGTPSLVVVGSRGLSPARRVLLGSISTKVLKAATVPVLVCPEPYEREGTGRLREDGEERHP